MLSSTALFLAAAAGIALVAIAVLLIRLLRGGRGGARNQNTVLLVGLQNSGKTAFFFKLRDAKNVKTHTSQVENEATFVPKLQPASKTDSDLSISKPIHVVDIPGHDRLRHKVKQYLPIAAAVLFFVDSVDFATSVTDNAHALYDLLTNAHIANKQVPICVLCNKSDISLFKKDHIRKQLEQELEKMRKTQASQIESQSDEDRRDVVDLVADEGRPFCFADNAQTAVSFVTCSITKDEHLDEVIGFISASMPQ